MADVFLSYKREDAARVRKLVAARFKHEHFRHNPMP